MSTIAYGTPEGAVEVQGEQVPVPVDEPSLRRLAEQHRRDRLHAPRASEELDQVYADIGSTVGTTTERREVTAAVTGVGLLLATAAAGASLALGGRFP